MQKIISILLMGFFAFSVFEIYVKPDTVKNCCCSSASMCRCKHGGGECLLALQEKMSSNHCKMGKREKSEPEKPIGTFFIKHAGCGSGNSPVISPQFHKDLFFDLKSNQSFALPSDLLVNLNSNFYNFIPSFFIDRPPKTISF